MKKMDEIVKYLKVLSKKYKLLHKYKPNRQEYLSDCILFKDNLQFLIWLKQDYDAEVRCYNRIKKLKQSKTK